MRLGTGLERVGVELEEEPVTQFNFHGDVRGEVFNQAGRDMTIIGDQGSRMTVEEARAEVRLLQQELRRLPLPPHVAAEAGHELASAANQLGEPGGDRRSVARSLERFTEIVRDVGALATAGTALVGPLTTLAHWLGATGKPILGLLGMA